MTENTPRWAVEWAKDGVPAGNGVFETEAEAVEWCKGAARHGHRLALDITKGQDWSEIFTIKEVTDD